MLSRSVGSGLQALPNCWYALLEYGQASQSVRSGRQAILVCLEWSAVPPGVS